jgi:ABC-type nickel/cobalt efflux system permease component RcnA
MPCPSALVVILSAIALGRIGFGLALVTAFSLGLAGVLTGVGLILVYARQWFETLPWQAPKIRLLPAMSALLMAFIGLGITTQALLQIGAS